MDNLNFVREEDNLEIFDNPIVPRVRNEYFHHFDDSASTVSESIVSSSVVAKDVAEYERRQRAIALERQRDDEAKKSTIVNLQLSNVFMMGGGGVGK